MSPLKVSDFEDIWPKIDTVIDSGEITTSSRAGSTIVKYGSGDKITDYEIIRDGVAVDLFKRAVDFKNVHMHDKSSAFSESSSAPGS